MASLLSLSSRARKRLDRFRFAPAINVVPPIHSLLRLGSHYGGWTFEDSPDLRAATIISCGLGEDASFDVEFAAHYESKVLIVDPTPRAVRHFHDLTARIGRNRERQYSRLGKQHATAYDLSRIGPGSLILEASALWSENTYVKFYAPRDPDHVSHSIINFQNGYNDATPSIIVPAITIDTLLCKYELTSVPLMKLDIEGAEVKVLPLMMSLGIYPRQLLIEFDEMNKPSGRSKTNAETVDGLLRGAGYSCSYFDGATNFLYVRS